MKHLITDWEDAGDGPPNRLGVGLHQLLFNQERRCIGEVMQTGRDDPNMRYVYGWWHVDEAGLAGFAHNYSPDFEEAKAIVIAKLIEEGAVHQPKLRAMI